MYIPQTRRGATLLFSIFREAIKQAIIFYPPGNLRIVKTRGESEWE
jgi:hypothetical protein